jgi:hypothetical protein
MRRAQPGRRSGSARGTASPFNGAYVPGIVGKFCPACGEVRGDNRWCGVVRTRVSTSREPAPRPILAFDMRTTPHHSAGPLGGANPRPRQPADLVSSHEGHDRVAMGLPERQVDRLSVDPREEVRGLVSGAVDNHIRRPRPLPPPTRMAPTTTAQRHRIPVGRVRQRAGSQLAVANSRQQRLRSVMPPSWPACHAGCGLSYRREHEHRVVRRIGQFAEVPVDGSMVNHGGLR